MPRNRSPHIPGAATTFGALFIQLKIKAENNSVSQRSPGKLICGDGAHQERIVRFSRGKVARILASYCLMAGRVSRKKRCPPTTVVLRNRVSRKKRCPPTTVILRREQVGLVQRQSACKVKDLDSRLEKLVSEAASGQVRGQERTRLRESL